MMRLLRALLFNIAFYVDTVAMGVLALPFLLTPRRTCMRFGRFWAQTVLFLVKWTVGLDSEIRGRENIPPGGCLIAMKHQSMWDTLILPPLLGFGLLGCHAAAAAGNGPAGAGVPGLPPAARASRQRC